jgi:hypothetical protein
MVTDAFVPAAAALGALLCAVAAAQTVPEPLDILHPAIAYGRAEARDSAAVLARRLDLGEVELPFDRRTGYLRGVLEQLDIPVESQVAVYSKTSLQSAIVSPANPRVIYFNDATAVAWMPGGFIEIASQDPQQGTRFYMLPQAPGAQLFADNRCLGCHHSVAAGGVPGLLVRSIPTAADGALLPWLGNATPDHRTPLEERWGGWYVTGAHGRRHHLGNLKLSNRRAQALPAWSADRALETLAGEIDTDKYLSPHSDAVALLVFEHQATAMNLLTRTGWLSRIASHDKRSASPDVEAAVAELVDYFLFVGEAPLDGVRGTSGYAEYFSARGPRDSRGRSLRDLDLRTRLLRYPCSYMIYSAAFDALPDDIRERVYRRLKGVLSGEEAAAKYAHLSAADRQAILDILRETKSGIPGWF